MSAYPAQSDPTAVVGRRFGAFVIDSIVLAVIPLALFFATAGITLYERPTTCTQVAAKPGELSSSERCRKVDVTVNDTEYSAATFKPAAAFLASGVYLLYLILVEWIVQAMTGATLGKAIFGIRTVDEEGNAPGLGKQLIRGLLWIIDAICSALLAAILILVTKGHRRLGDMAAKTFVVRAGAKGSPIVVPGMATAAVGAGAGAATVGAYGAPSSPPTSSYAPPAPGTMGTTPPMAATAATDPTTVAPTPTPTSPGASGPQWDAGRNAYIQWDPAGNRWLTYDEAASEWKPIVGEQPPPPSV